MKKYLLIFLFFPLGLSAQIGEINTDSLPRYAETYRSTGVGRDVLLFGGSSYSRNMLLKPDTVQAIFLCSDTTKRPKGWSNDIEVIYQCRLCGLILDSSKKAKGPQHMKKDKPTGDNR
jgi:hypothetical protein